MLLRERGTCSGTTSVLPLTRAASPLVKVLQPLLARGVTCRLLCGRLPGRAMPASKEECTPGPKDSPADRRGPREPGPPSVWLAGLTGEVRCVARLLLLPM